MLAAPVGVDGLVKGNVRRLVAGQDALGALLDDLRGRRQGLGVERLRQGTPAVIELFALLALKAMGHCPSAAPTFQGVRGNVERLRRLDGWVWPGFHTVCLYSISGWPSTKKQPPFKQLRAALAPNYSTPASTRKREGESAL